MRACQSSLKGNYDKAIVIYKSLYKDYNERCVQHENVVRTGQREKRFGIRNENKHFYVIL